MKKKILVILTALMLVFAIPFSTAYAGETSANFQSGLPTGWTVAVKESSQSTVDIVDGKLTMNNDTGHTEIRLPDLETTDFALTFKASRKGGDEKENGYDYPSFSIRYNMNDDFTKGYEVRVHYKQEGLNQSCYADIFWYSLVDVKQDSGPALEHRIINPDDPEITNKILTFGYYKTRIHEDVEYEYTITLSGNVMQLWINGDVYMKDILDVEERTGNFAICMDGPSQVAFDDFRVYSLQQFANEKIDALPEILANQEYSVQREYEAEIIEVEKFITEAFGNNAVNLEKYSDLVAKKQALENAYGIIKARTPKITVEWALDSVKAGTKLNVPFATAIDEDGNYYYVESTVTFGGRKLKKTSNAVVVNEAGEYTVTYVARNAFGESTQIVKTFTVTENTSTNMLAIILISVGSVLVIGAVIANILLFRRKKV